MTQFCTGIPTHPLRRPDGRIVSCTVPVEWPQALLADDEWFQFEAEGYRVGDRRPAALCGSDSGSWLWYCSGEAFEADRPSSVAKNQIN
jgi:hypothetical protein